MKSNKTDVSFRPPWWMKNPHVQTILPTVLPQKLADHKAKLHKIELTDGDAIALHEDCPKEWLAGGKVAILSHGLTDHHRTPLLVRLTEKLTPEECGYFDGTCVVVVQALNGLATPTTQVAPMTSVQ